MRLIRTSMLVTVAACALGALAASSASAALPEIGRCVKVEGVKEGHTTKFDGKYSTTNAPGPAAPRKASSNGSPARAKKKRSKAPARWNR